MKIYYSLYDRLLNYEALSDAFNKVYSANGSAGLDGIGVKEFENDQRIHLNQLLYELKDKTYRPSPVLRVEIPKDGGAVRKLGIPTVRDRIVQQAVTTILSPIFEEDFHVSSFGYRPKHSCHQAIAKSMMYIRKYHLDHVVDMDLSKCFDTLDHGFLMKCLRKRVVDGSLLNLIKLFLESGIMDNGNFEESVVGSPQGGVISPLLSNIYLNEFDQEMKRRNHRIIRYADDILIFKRTKKGAEKALKSATEILEKQLKLTVNLEKTHIAHSSKGIKYLGIVIYKTVTSIQDKKLKAMKSKLKKMTARNSPVNLAKLVSELNPVLRGYANYFRIANCKGNFEAVMAWLRRRLRSKQLKLWKKPRRLHRELRKQGYSTEGLALIKMSTWRNSCSPQVHRAIGNDFFDKIGLYNLQKVEVAIPVQFPVEIKGGAVYEIRTYGSVRGMDYG